LTEVYTLPTTFLTNQTFSLAFVPTPGAAALLGLGGLLAARRRRA
jgi:MYXO-CTERM domain-containing protein